MTLLSPIQNLLLHLVSSLSLSTWSSSHLKALITLSSITEAPHGVKVSNEEKVGYQIHSLPTLFQLHRPKNLGTTRTFIGICLDDCFLYQTGANWFSQYIAEKVEVTPRSSRLTAESLKIGILGSREQLSQVPPVLHVQWNDILWPSKTWGRSSSWRQDSSSSSASSSKIVFLGPVILVGWQELSLFGLSDQ
jgi:hypothetical protein